MKKAAKYLEVYNRVKEKILSSEYRVGDRLPTEKELAETYGVSVHTVRQAMSMFKTEGVVQKTAGSGTFIQAMPGEGRGEYTSAKNIAVVVWEQTRHMFPRLIPAIEETVYHHGYHNIVANTGRDPQREREIIERLVAQGIRGFIISPVSWEARCLENYQYILDQKVPLVFVNQRVKEVRASSVIIDNEDVGYQSTMRLLGAGHRRIGHLTSKKIWPDLVSARLRGYSRALEQHGLQVDENLVVYDHTDSDVKGYYGAQQLFDSGSGMTAVFCVNDEHVAGLYKAAIRRNIQVPWQLSVVGFDQSEEVQAGLPFRLDTMRYPAEDVGICAAQDLLQQMTNPGRSIVQTVELYPTLIVGESIRAV